MDYTGEELGEIFLSGKLNNKKIISGVLFADMGNLSLIFSNETGICFKLENTEVELFIEYRKNYYMEDFGKFVAVIPE